MTDSPPPGQHGGQPPATPPPWFPPAGDQGAAPWPGVPGYGPPGAGYSTPPPGYGAPPPGYGAPPPGYGPAPRYGEATPKPGVVPLRPLGLGEILDGAFATIRRNPRTVLSLAAVVMTVAAVVTAVLSRALLNVPAVSGPLTAHQAEHLLRQLLSGAIPLLAALLLLDILVRAVLAGLLAPVIAREVGGQRIGARDAWRATAPRLPALFGATLLVLLASLAPAGVVLAGVAVAGVAGAPGTVLALIAVPGGALALALTLWIPTMLSLVTPVVVLEGAGPRRALARSWRLVWRSFWRVFGILLLAEIIVGVTASILQLPFSFLASALPGIAGVVLGTVGSIAAGTVTQPITAAVTVLLYVDRRMRTEGLDLALRTAAGTGVPLDEPGFAAAWRPPAESTVPPPPPGGSGASGPGIPPATAGPPPPW